MAEKKREAVTIQPLNLKLVAFRIEGNAPYVQNRFGEKALKMMHDKMEAGSTAKKGAKKPPRDFQGDYENAKHVSEEGWLGMPAPAFRTAMVDACRTVGFKMTHAKLAVFVKADGFDRVDGMPLVKIEGEPEYMEMYVRNSTGVCDLRARPMWKEWAAEILIEYDADMFTLDDVSNLMVRVGKQCGIGAGRPNSKMSTGLGWGTFDVVQAKTGRKE